MLGNYQGSLLLVSHDRTFLDNVVTSTLVFEGHGKIQEYVGGYQDWLRQAARLKTNQAIIEKTTKESSKDKPKTTTKLSYKEQKELADFPKLIEKLETEQHKLQSIIADPNFYQQSPEVIAKDTAKLKELEATLSTSLCALGKIRKIRLTHVNSAQGHEDRLLF